MPVESLPGAPVPAARPSSIRALALIALVAVAAAPPASAQEATRTAEEPVGFVAHSCPIAGQQGAVVLGTGGSFQAACLALSKPGKAARQCPRPVLSMLDQSGAVTIRFLPVPAESWLADPASCCRAAEIAVDPDSGRIRIAAAPANAGDQPGDCAGDADPVDIYEWNGAELVFVERQAPAE